ncbi:myb/SANT-like DNA-binding domain-containing protein 3 isoform 2-T2 [Rhinophrynus dorsalis]
MQNNEVLKPAKYFSELEKSVLLSLVEKYKYVLECKKSDARTIALKQRTWQALAHEYNSQPSVSLRDFKQLKKCWENIKARTKKIMAHEMRDKGKCESNSHNALKEKVASMIIPEQLYFAQHPEEEKTGFNHDTSNQDLDCKRVNLVDLELLIDEHGKIQAQSFRKVPENNSLCAEGSPSRSIKKGTAPITVGDTYQACNGVREPSTTHEWTPAQGITFHNGDLELLIDEQGKVQAEPRRKVQVTDSLCVESTPSGGLKKESFVVSDRDVYEEGRSRVNMQDCENSMNESPSFSSSRLSTNVRTYGRKPSQNGIFTKMREEEHHQQMSILHLQLIQMNEVHVAKVQQIERECEMAEEEHRIKMEILNKKKMYWERKLQTVTKEWPVTSFNRPFPNSP